MTNTFFEPGQKQQFQCEAVSLAPGGGAKGPFSLDNEEAYARWRDVKLAGFPKTAADLVVEVKDSSAPSAFELDAIRDRVRRCNMAVYAVPVLADVEDSKDQVCALGRCFGLHHLDKNPYADEDAITPLHVAAGAQRLEAGRKMYIPYTSRPINWHTDGYYNTPARRIRAMILHCVRPAGTAGGQNALFDPEMVYLLMRERDPEMVAALCADEAMTIPGNDVDTDVNRGDVTGPVFSLNRKDGSLYMRYTARKRNIVWAKDAASQKAVAFMEEILTDGGPGEPYIFRHTMKPGEGLICNNVLHTRTGFEDGAQDDLNRMMLRARYIERIEGTASLI
ncbi:TauD/TfdA family dioxygenase [Magnetovibrio blakemorei]|uniref:TauD/TfdA family dioxygenase n=1 Tax=Magnetovibrio blakemorei TaxID=28181 RepID=UPI0009FD8999|nr:TauD/TfdA family dioxygenase [Magnetovibrio blakemorei]